MTAQTPPTAPAMSERKPEKGLLATSSASLFGSSLGGTGSVGSLEPEGGVDMVERCEDAKKGPQALMNVLGFRFSRMLPRLNNELCDHRSKGCSEQTAVDRITYIHWISSGPLSWAPPHTRNDRNQPEWCTVCSCSSYSSASATQGLLPSWETPRSHARRQERRRVLRAPTAPPLIHLGGAFRLTRRTNASSTRRGRRCCSQPA
jgi:hypothetical protein